MRCTRGSCRKGAWLGGLWRQHGLAGRGLTILRRTGMGRGGGLRCDGCSIVRALGHDNAVVSDDEVGSVVLLDVLKELNPRRESSVAPEVRTVVPGRHRLRKVNELAVVGAARPWASALRGVVTRQQIIGGLTKSLA